MPTNAQSHPAVVASRPASKHELMEALGQKMRVYQTAVDRLEAKGLVRRTRDADDRRRVLIEATDETLRRSTEIYGPLFEVGTRLLAR